MGEGGGLYGVGFDNFYFLTHILYISDFLFYDAVIHFT